MVLFLYNVFVSFCISHCMCMSHLYYVAALSAYISPQLSANQTQLSGITICCAAMMHGLPEEVCNEIESIVN